MSVISTENNLYKILMHMQVAKRSYHHLKLLEVQPQKYPRKRVVFFLVDPILLGMMKDQVGKIQLNFKQSKKLDVEIVFDYSKV